MLHCGSQKGLTKAVQVFFCVEEKNVLAGAII